MPRILDTMPAFQRFAGAAIELDGVGRQQQWTQRYRGAHPEIFDAFFAAHGDRSGLPAVLGKLVDVRQRAQAAVVHLPDLIATLEPAVIQALGAHGLPEPLHVLLVGTFSANAFVAPIDDDLGVFHCLEWFTYPDVAGVLVAHETAHAWHRRRVGAPDEPDLAWELFSEGLALATSRTAMPEQSPDDYFWYGVAGFEDWLPWCREHRADLLADVRRGLDDPEAVDAFFGGGFVREHWRTGFFVADILFEHFDRPLEELAGLDIDTARDLVRTALDAS